MSLHRITLAVAASVLLCGLALAGCGGGNGGGAADPRDALVGTWDGTAIPRASRGRDAVPAHMTIEFVKDTDGNSLTGSFVLTVEDSSSRAPRRSPFDLGMLNIGEIVGTIQHGLSEDNIRATLKAHLDPKGVVQEVQGDANLITKVGAMTGTANLNNINYDLSLTQSQAGTLPLDISHTQWNGGPANQGGLTVVGGKAVYKLSINIGPETVGGALTASMTGTAPDGSTFTVPVAFGTVTGSVLRLIGVLPADAPPIQLGQGLSFPLAGREFQYQASVSGDNMGASPAGVFALQLTDQEAQQAAFSSAFGYDISKLPGTENFFKFGTASLTKGPARPTTGGISVPID